MKTILEKKHIHSTPTGKLKSVSVRLLGLMIGCMGVVYTQAQADKRLALADQYFSAGEYYTAAGLYGQFLSAAVTAKTPSDFVLNSKRTTIGTEQCIGQ